MTRNVTADTLSYSRERIGASGSDGVRLRKMRLPVFILILAPVIVFLAWSGLAPLISGSGDGDAHWRGVNEQTISERMVAGNGKNWNAGFTLFADDDKVLVTLNIKLLPQNGITMPALDRTRQAWSKGIDVVWNDRFYLRLPDRRLIPIVLAVNFKSVNVHHEVIVRKGGADPNQHNWYMNTNAGVVAHEIGHMLGAYDEYRSGATSPLPHRYEGVSLMGKRAGDGIPRVHHLHLLQEKLVEITGLQSLVIVQPGVE